MGVDQKDSTVYPIDLSGVCDIAFTEDDPPQVVCNNWSVGGYGAPSNATLLTFAPADVFSWYDGFYTNPQLVADSQPAKLTSAKIASMRTSSDMVGYTVYNTTVHRQQYYDGTNWVSMW